MLRVRQIALVANDDIAAAEELIDVLGLAIGYHDPHIERIQLHNTLLPIGTQLLEIVSPLTPGSRPTASSSGATVPAATWSSRRPTTTRRAAARVDELGIRIVGQFHDDDFVNMQLHPRDTGGSFLEIDQQIGGDDPMGPWSPAGPNWQDAIRTDLVSAITAAEMQCDDPDKVATRWSEIVEIDRADVAGVPTIPLDNATLRFVPITDGRGEGLGGIDLACADPDTVRANAERARRPRRRRPRLPRRDALLPALKARSVLQDRPDRAASEGQVELSGGRG